MVPVLELVYVYFVYIPVLELVYFVYITIVSTSWHNCNIVCVHVHECRQFYTCKICPCAQYDVCTSLRTDIIIVKTIVSSSWTHCACIHNVYYFTHVTSRSSLVFACIVNRVINMFDLDFFFKKRYNYTPKCA